MVYGLRELKGKQRQEWYTVEFKPFNIICIAVMIIIRRDEMKPSNFQNNYHNALTEREEVRERDKRIVAWTNYTPHVHRT